MPAFRIFYFRSSELDHVEQVEAPSVVDAIRSVAGKPQFLRAEIWSETGKVGIIGPPRG